MSQTNFICGFNSNTQKSKPQGHRIQLISTLIRMSTHLAPVAFMASMVTAFRLLGRCSPCLPARMCARKYFGRYDLK